MSRFKFLSTSDESHLSRHVNELREDLRSSDPQILASLTASYYEPQDPGKGNFQLKVWGEETHLSFPELVATGQNTGQEASMMVQALLAYYYHTADGSSIADQWISFSELPDGRFYNQAFQGYTGKELWREYKDDIDSFTQAAGTIPTADIPQIDSHIGDRAFTFQALPRVPLLIVYWQGDEDFPSTYQILFNASAPHYLPTDVCAILGSMLTRRLIAEKGIGN